MDSQLPDLHILLFPFPAQGHTLPTIDLAKLFAYHGVKVTVLTTPANVPLFQPPITRANASGLLNPIHLSLIPFPSVTGLPEGCENMSSVPKHLKSNFLEAVASLQEPFKQILIDTHPDCVVAGMFLHWIHDVAFELDIPTLDFHGTNFFSKCAADSLARNNVIKNLTPEVDLVALPNLPHKIEMRRGLIPDFKKVAPVIADLIEQRKVSELKSYGMIMNSFYELEADYVDYYRTVIGRRVWHVGPMFLCNEHTTDKATRGSKSSIDENVCLKWLDSKSSRSVLYVCFGSASNFSADQLRELAVGLEGSNSRFIWVVREEGEEWMPEGFEEKIEGRGLVIQGWAPQILILNHPAIGGFLTHCGWNSSLEGISAGLPFATWPLFAEQTFNERLIVDVLKIGVAVGVTDFIWKPEDRALVKAATIENAVSKLMCEDEEAEARRIRAKVLGESAKKAVEKDGSSYVSLSNLIQELKGLPKH